MFLSVVVPEELELLLEELEEELEELLELELELLEDLLLELEESLLEPPFPPPPPPPQATRDRDRDAARSRDNARFMFISSFIVFHKIFRDLTYPVGDFIVFHCGAKKQGTILRFFVSDCFFVSK